MKYPSLTLLLVCTALADPFSAVAAGNYPTDPEDMDKLCETLGKAPFISLPKQDQARFEQKCVCVGSAGCGRMGSKRFETRVEGANGDAGPKP